MDTIVRPPEAPPDQPVGTGTSRRRWPRRVGASFVIVLVVMAIGALVWVTNVEPLGPGSTTFPIGDPRVRSTQRSIDAFDVTGVVNTVRVEEGTTFRYTVFMRNDGPVPVVIEAVSDTAQEDGISRRVVAMNPDPYRSPGPSEGFVPFVPFRLQPGGEAALQLEVDVEGTCILRGGGSVSWHQEPITYSIYGITRHSFVETRDEIRLDGTESTTC